MKKPPRNRFTLFLQYSQQTIIKRYIAYTCTGYWNIPWTAETQLNETPLGVVKMIGFVSLMIIMNWMLMIMHTFHNYFFILMLYLQCKCFIIFVFLILFLVVLLLKGKGNKRQGVLLLGVCDTGKTLMFHKVKHISKIFRYRIYIFYRKYVLTVYDLCIGKQKI